MILLFSRQSPVCPGGSLAGNWVGIHYLEYRDICLAPATQLLSHEHVTIKGRNMSDLDQ